MTIIATSHQLILVTLTRKLRKPHTHTHLHDARAPTDEMLTNLRDMQQWSQREKPSVRAVFCFRIGGNSLNGDHIEKRLLGIQVLIVLCRSRPGVKPIKHSEKTAYTNARLASVVL